jgi:hypothetical protein
MHKVARLQLRLRHLIGSSLFGAIPQPIKSPINRFHLPSAVRARSRFSSHSQMNEHLARVAAR